MKKLVLFAAVAGLGLVSNHPPQGDNHRHHPGHHGDRAHGERHRGPQEASGYPPCTRAVRDQCIQLRERGVRTRENLAANARHGPPRAPAVQTAAATPAATAPATRRAHARSQRLAMRVRRAGERG